MTLGLPLALSLGHPLGLTPGLPLGLTLGLSFGPHPCNSLCLGREPKARVATLLDKGDANYATICYWCYSSRVTDVIGFQ